MASAKKPRASGPSKSHAERLAKGETAVLVWLSPDYLAKLDAVATLAGNRRKAVEWLLDTCAKGTRTRRKP